MFVYIYNITCRRENQSPGNFLQMPDFNEWANHSKGKILLSAIEKSRLPATGKSASIQKKKKGERSRSPSSMRLIFVFSGASRAGAGLPDWRRQSRRLQFSRVASLHFLPFFYPPTGKVGPRCMIPHSSFYSGKVTALSSFPSGSKNSKNLVPPSS